MVLKKFPGIVKPFIRITGFESRKKGKVLLPVAYEYDLPNEKETSKSINEEESPYVFADNRHVVLEVEDLHRDLGDH